MMRHVLGSRASIGGVLGSGRGGAASDWWLSGGVSAANAIAVYQSIGAASLAASYTNLANPGTYDAAPGVAPTWAAATGWTFAAASAQYLTTGVVPANGASMVIRCRVTGDGVIAGHISGAVSQWMAVRWIASASEVRFYPGGVARWMPTTAPNGVIAIAGGKCFSDGTQVTDTGGGGVSGSADQINIGRYYGAETRYFNGDILAIAIYNTTLSAAQVASVSAAMAALTG